MILGLKTHFEILNFELMRTDRVGVGRYLSTSRAPSISLLVYLSLSTSRRCLWIYVRTRSRSISESLRQSTYMSCASAIPTNSTPVSVGVAGSEAPPWFATRVKPPTPGGPHPAVHRARGGRVHVHHPAHSLRVLPTFALVAHRCLVGSVTSVVCIRISSVHPSKYRPISQSPRQGAMTVAVGPLRGALVPARRANIKGSSQLRIPGEQMWGLPHILGKLAPSQMGVFIAACANMYL